MAFVSILFGVTFPLLGFTVALACVISISMYCYLWLRDPSNDAKKKGQRNNMPKILRLNGQLVCLLPSNYKPTDYACDLANAFNEREIDDTFCLCDLGKIQKRHEEWVKWLPRIKPYYAVKCNTDPMLLFTLAKLGCGFDCASKAEINAVLSLGLDPDEIIYANPCKAMTHMIEATKQNVMLMTYDNERELVKVKKICPDAKMILRIYACDPTAVLELSRKFGCNPYEESFELLEKAKELDISVVGISFHVGSGSRDPSSFAEAISHAKRIFEIGKSMGHEMQILDIGGGFPGYDSEDCTFSKMAEVINKSVDEHFPPGCGVTLIAEPGRFYASTFLSICTNVVGKRLVPSKEITETDEDGTFGPAFMYYMNDGILGTFNSVFIERTKPKGKPLKRELLRNQKFDCRVWGQTRDSKDYILWRTRLPELNIGDWLIWKNMGAYSTAVCTEFSGFSKPCTYYAVTEKDWESLKHSMKENCSDGGDTED